MADQLPPEPPENKNDNKTTKKQAPKPPKQESGGGSNAFWYLLIGFALIAFALHFSNLSDSEEIKFSEFVESLKTDKQTVCSAQPA